jgi:DNA-3-methyladenine glycosylase
MLLGSDFFSHPTATVAKDLLGQILVRKTSNSVWIKARIVETEAYLEKEDPAAHCSRGITPRSKVMWGKPGTIYIYFIYGMYYMLNFVTEKPGTAGAVLVRAVEPIEGITRPTNGPAKLVLAFGIGKELNGKPLGLPHLGVIKGKPVSSEKVVVTTRIGISSGKDLPLRFYEKGNPFVSRL